MSKYEPVRSTERLDRIWGRGKDFLGSELPILCGAMTWISDANLVSTMSNLGAFGALAAGNMPPEMFADEVDKTKSLTDRPFAGNVITIAPNYKPHLDILCEKKVSHIIFAGSLPRGNRGQAEPRRSGAKVLCFASTGFDRQAHDQLRRRRAHSRGQRGRRSHRPRLDHRAAAGDPLPVPRRFPSSSPAASPRAR